MKYGIIPALIAVLFLNNCGNSKPITGYWLGEMELNGKTVDISLLFDSESCLFTSNDLMLFERKVDELIIRNNAISFSLNLETESRFEGVIENSKITGSVVIRNGPPNMKISFTINKKLDTIPNKTYSIEKLIIKGKGADISAEIYKPALNKLHPAIVLLHGSSTNLKSQYSFYANFFANLGFEVLIFDKRGSGQSTGNYSTSSYDDLVDDAISCLYELKKRVSVDTTRIGLWGYSQGAMLLPYILTKTEIPTFLIAKSPEVYSVSEAAAFSDSLRVLNRGNSPASGHTAAETHRRVSEMILNGNDYKKVEDYINEVASEYSFMNQTGLYGNISIDENEFDGYYWKERGKNFYPYWKKNNIKTLLLFGEDDEYINTRKNEEVVLSFSNAKTTVKVFTRSNHAMKKTFNMAKYPDFDWPRIKEGYLDYVEKWITKEVL